MRNFFKMCCSLSPQNRQLRAGPWDCKDSPEAFQNSFNLSFFLESAFFQNAKKKEITSRIIKVPVVIQTEDRFFFYVFLWIFLLGLPLRPSHPSAPFQVRQPRAEAQDLGEAAQAIAARHLGPLVAPDILASRHGTWSTWCGVGKGGKLHQNLVGGLLNPSRKNRSKHIGKFSPAGFDIDMKPLDPTGRTSAEAPTETINSL